MKNVKWEIFMCYNSFLFVLGEIILHQDVTNNFKHKGDTDRGGSGVFKEVKYWKFGNMILTWQTPFLIRSPPQKK